MTHLTNTLVLRLQKDMKNELIEFADDLGISLSQLCREALKTRIDFLNSYLNKDPL